MALQSRPDVRLPVRVPRRPGPRQDNGLFGPDSVAWEVITHPVVTVAIFRNTVFSALIPEVSRALAEHGKTLRDPIARAQETAYGIFTPVFGDSAEARIAGKWVHSKHRPVKGHDPVTRSDYSPMRPDLAIAGHGIIWECYVVVYETYVRRLSDADRDRYWREGLIMAELIGMDPGIVPPTWAAWREYYDAELLPRFSFSSAAHRIVTYRMGGSYAPALARPAYRLGTAGLMELVLATIGPRERALFGRRRSGVQLAATRLLGRRMFAAATTPRVRDAVEQAISERTHELFSEAREIRASHDPGAVVSEDTRQEALRLVGGGA